MYKHFPLSLICVTFVSINAFCNPTSISSIYCDFCQPVFQWLSQVAVEVTLKCLVNWKKILWYFKFEAGLCLYLPLYCLNWVVPYGTVSHTMLRVSLCNFSYTFFRGLFKMFNMCSLTRFEVLIAGLLKISLLGYYSLSLVHRYWCFKGSQCLHLQDHAVQE
jgi:hypothetical protein